MLCKAKRDQLAAAGTGGWEVVGAGEVCIREVREGEERGGGGGALKNCACALKRLNNSQRARICSAHAKKASRGELIHKIQIHTHTQAGRQQQRRQRQREPHTRVTWPLLGNRRRRWQRLLSRLSLIAKQLKRWRQLLSQRSPPSPPSFYTVSHSHPQSPTHTLFHCHQLPSVPSIYP